MRIGTSTSAIRSKLNGILHREVPLITCLIGAVLLAVGYVHVPIARECQEGMKLHYYVGFTDVECAQPPFTLRCTAPSVYRLVHNSSEVLCRTARGRAARIIDDSKRQLATCKGTLGQLGRYDANRGCHCDPHSTQDDGLCIPTDGWCQQWLGTGAVALISESGDQYTCGCETGYSLNVGHRRCEPTNEHVPSTSLPFFPLRP